MTARASEKAMRLVEQFKVRLRNGYGDEERAALLAYVAALEAVSRDARDYTSPCNHEPYASILRDCPDCRKRLDAAFVNLLGSLAALDESAP